MVQLQHVRQTPARILILPRKLRTVHAAISRLVQAKCVVGDVQFKFQVATVSFRAVCLLIYIHLAYCNNVVREKRKRQIGLVIRQTNYILGRVTTLKAVINTLKYNRF